MLWSTRQLAELVGVTLRSIRHWHDVGLLPEPERLTNGYKQYTAQHLVLALRIARLSGLGFTLEQVAEALASEEEGRSSLRGLRAELDARITELLRVRSEVDELIDLGASPDLSPAALLAADALGDDPASRNIAIVLAHLVASDHMPAFARILGDAPAHVAHTDAELRRLPPDATEDEIDSLVARTVTAVEEFLASSADTVPFITRVDEHTSTEVLSDLVTAHLNPAQRRVVSLVMRHLSDDHG